ncbi:MAG TPA: ATP-binding protein [Sulfurimonas sp.]|uniref:ATP-binding protein n=1 Tax=Sulfurimonas sp. TaxID=2022749 RepID=UPI002C55D570|nr:ATP-binding protein [Sulfurimonas sp.]HUH43144.1 ATP-binding protein [Sulfurimonas sp.]
MSFELKFSPVIIKHLGLSMYSTLPPVLSELITNSYDADASIVIIKVNQSAKSIEIIDNGCGMNANELNDDFLNVGRNRRKKDSSTTTIKFKRKVTGKKGIGKLSVFGICKEIYVESCKDNKINAFSMKYDELINRNDNTPLKIEPDINNFGTKHKSYTKIILKDLTRITELPIIATADSILTRLNLFDKNFRCVICDHKTKKKLTHANRVALIEEGKQFEWNIPDSFDELNIDVTTKEYIIKNNITGKILTTKDTIKEAFKGITLYARGKLANNPEFYGVKLSNSHAFSYMSGEIFIDYMDNDSDKDHISTARNSLIWDDSEASLLQVHLQHIIKKAGQLWREKRKEARIVELVQGHKIDLEWYDTMMQSAQDKRLAKKITDLIVSSELGTTQTKDLLSYVEGAFEFDVFKNYAADIENEINDENLLKLLKDWEVIESKEHYRIALGRLETINKFKHLIRNDTKEVGGVDSMHAFLKTFPWILEPRLSSFEDETRYKDLLLKHFPEDISLDIKDRRIDFLCKSFGGTLYVLEIKRSQKIIGKEELEQLQEYYEFVDANIKENNSDRTKYSKVKAYIIGKDLKDDKIVRSRRDILEKSDMHFLSYEEMLNQAEEYHRDFINNYESVNNLKLLNSTN